MQENIDYLWVTVCAIFVFAMQAGFMCLEAGLSRKKNNINVALKNLADFGVATSLFWVYGFSLMFASSANGWLGDVELFFDDAEPRTLVIFVFQAMFVATAASIVSGAVAERTRFYAYLLIAALTAGLLYPVIGHWAWGGSLGGDPGWLAAAGFYDFAGSTVVHSTGGWVALAAVLVIGPRIGRFAPDGSPRRFSGSNVPIAVLGVLILWGGWFGFNGGSAGRLDAHTPIILVNTFLAGAAGLIGGGVAGWLRARRLDTEALTIGPLAGLVSVTAGCAVVSPGAAVGIGLVGGIVGEAGRTALVRLRVDDVVGAVPVHLLGGIWGTVAVALLGDRTLIGSGLGRLEQLGAQLLGIGACAVVAFGGGYVALRLIDRVYRLRVSPLEEDVGLNIAEHDASTDHWELVKLMRRQAESADLSLRAPQDPFTDAGHIGVHYNQLLAVLEQADAELKQWRQRVQAELTLAVEIQRSFLPRFEQSRFPIHAINRPARELSGDFYDIVSFDGERVHFVVADVSGKGIHAAVVMAQSIALFRAYSRTEMSPADMAWRMNRELCRTATQGMFVTLVLGTADIEHDRVTMVNAGHEPPLQRRAGGEWRAFKASSPPIGITPDLEPADFEQAEIDLGKGALYLFTDGVTEAVLDGATGTLGADGFRRLVDEQAGRRKEERIDRVVAQIDAGAGSRSDDITVMVIESVAQSRGTASAFGRDAAADPSPA